jgi:hypothetical protein
MSQVILESSNREDLDLILTFAKRLKINVISINSVDTEIKLQNRRLILQKAANDPLYLADIAEITNNFSHL